MFVYEKVGKRVVENGGVSLLENTMVFHGIYFFVKNRYKIYKKVLILDKIYVKINSR